MVINESHLNSSSSPDPTDTVLNRPPWVTTTLGCFLIFTIVVDILGNLLVIFSVYRNKKLRNAGDSMFCLGFFVLLKGGGSKCARLSERVCCVKNKTKTLKAEHF